MGDLDYDNVCQEFRGFVYPGKLKLKPDEVLFKNVKTGLNDHYSGADVSQAEWLLRARGYCLRIMLKNGVVHRYDGFVESDFVRLAGFFLKNYSVDLVKKELSYKGWNWGNTKFEGNSLKFDVAGNMAFDVPLNNVANVTSAKNEMVLEFHQNDDAEIGIMEIRFHIPESEAQDTQVDEFYKNVMKKAEIIQLTGDSLVQFSEVQCLQPRGRYDLKIYPTFIHLHGKTFDYKIPVSTILRMFLLPHKVHNQMFFVINIDPPLKLGQTRHHFIIFLYDKDIESTVELTGSEEEIAEKYEGKLTKEMVGSEYEIVARIFKSICQRKITIPGSFTSRSGDKAISCSHKASTGFLYPLDRGFIFVFKPSLHIRFDEISYVQFGRGALVQRTFDFDIETKNKITYTFNSIEKEEYSKLFDFVKERKLRVKNTAEEEVQGAIGDEWSSSEEEHDAYLVKMKAEGRKTKTEGGVGMEEDDDDEDDEDFQPPESGSEVAEEYDSNVSTSSSNSDEDYSGGGSDEASKPKKVKKEKEKKKTKSKSKESSGGKKKKKAPKDSNMPKRPMTAFMLWMNENRKRLTSEVPEGQPITAVSKLAGEQWKVLSEQEKERYQKMNDDDKVRYEEEMVEYKRKIASGEIVSSVSNKPKSTKKKTPSKPSGESTSGADNFKSAQFVESSDGSTSEEDDSSDKEDDASDEDKKDVKEDDVSDDSD